MTLGALLTVPTSPNTPNSCGWSLTTPCCSLGTLQGWAAGTEQLSDLCKGESAGLEELKLKAGAELEELAQVSPAVPPGVTLHPLRCHFPVPFLESEWPEPNPPFQHHQCWYYCISVLLSKSHGFHALILTVPLEFKFLILQCKPPVAWKAEWFWG